MKIDTLPSLSLKQQPGRGTIEQVISLEQIVEKSFEFNNHVYIVSIDFAKAFDSITHDWLWKLLEENSINNRYISLLKSTYDNTTTSIKTVIGISRSLNVWKRVMQRDALSTLLFCIAIAAIISKTDLYVLCVL